MSRIAEIRQNTLRKNDLLAAELWRRFAESGVGVVSLVSSPGAGKTSLLESTLQRLQPRHSVAALVGDPATDCDAQRLSRAAQHVQQITTGTVCHLDADMIAAAINGWALDTFDLLFLENVGNLVCPAGYDLGKSMRAVLLSVTEGEDKPLKYPRIFNTADVAIITKIDLAEAVGFRRDEAHANIHEVAPALRVLEVSARSGTGMDRWIDMLDAVRVHARARLEEQAAAGIRPPATT